MGPALAVGLEGAAEVFDVDCTAPITCAHLQRVNGLLPDGVRITDAQALLPGAPSLGRLVDGVRYLVAPPPGGRGWPESPAGLDPELAQAVRSWQPLEGGALRLELNARQEAGPTPSLKKLLIGLGLDERQAAAQRAVREGLVLRPRPAAAKQPSPPAEAAVS
jgi:hypothetical protein